MELSKIKNFLESGWDILEKSQDEKMLPTMRLLHEHLENPRSYIAFVGETSSGKSTLINALLNRRFLPAGPKPTTGTVTWIEHGISPLEKLYAINRNDASVEEITKEQFDALARKPDENLLRLKADIPLSRAEFKGLTIFDTPGYDSIIEQHEEVLKEFLPESDIILFTLFYRVGFQMADQEMMSLIADIDCKFGERPIFLVVNRVPEGVDEHDGRVKEIRLHAEDTLHRKVNLVLVKSSAPDKNGNSTLPNADELWRQVAQIAFSEDRKKELEIRTRDVLLSLFKKRQLEIASTLNSIKSGLASIPELQQQIVRFQESESKSYEIINAFAAKWEKQIPAKIKSGMNQLIENINNEIDNSAKWIDMNTCRNYLFGHMIPFGTKRICKEIEEYLYSQFEELDEKLSEMASTTVKKMNDRVQTIQSPEIKELLTSLSIKIGYKLAGDAANVITRSFGGCCGSAAGVGNLVKMGVKKVGNFFGKTFSKEVYKNIGKIFTKKMLAAMNVALDVVVEVIDYFHESLTWQTKLKEEVGKILMGWYDEVQNDFSSNMLAEYKKNNVDNVRECYHNLIDDIKHEIDIAKQQHSQGEIADLNDQLNDVESFISQLGEA